jgi:hypothetical protein
MDFKAVSMFVAELDANSSFFQICHFTHLYSKAHGRIETSYDYTVLSYDQSPPSGKLKSFWITPHTKHYRNHIQF